MEKQESVAYRINDTFIIIDRRQKRTIEIKEYDDFFNLIYAEKIDSHPIISNEVILKKFLNDFKLNDEVKKYNFDILDDNITLRNKNKKFIILRNKILGINESPFKVFTEIDNHVTNVIAKHNLKLSDVQHYILYGKRLMSGINQHKITVKVPLKVLIELDYDSDNYSKDELEELFNVTEKFYYNHSILVKFKIINSNNNENFKRTYYNLIKEENNVEITE